MCVIKLLIIFCATLCVCYCQHDRHKYKECGHEVLWHGFHYLTFLALKLKFIFVVGSIFTVAVIVGKVFAAFKLFEYMKKKYINDHQEMVYVMPHSYGHDSLPYSNGFSDFESPYHQSFPSDFSLDHPPSDSSHGDNSLATSPYGVSGPGQDIAGSAQDFPGPPQDFPSPTQDFAGPGHGDISDQAYGHVAYGRSNNFGKSSIYESFNAFNKIVRRLNITEMIFDRMNVKSEACKRKFVCESDFNVKESVILKAAFNMFIDDSYKRYKTNKFIKSFEECDALYPNCQHMDSTRSNLEV